MVGRGVGPNIWALSLYTDLTGYPILNPQMGSPHSLASKCGLVQFSSCLFIVPHLKIREKKWNLVTMISLKIVHNFLTHEV